MSKIIKGRKIRGNTPVKGVLNEINENISFEFQEKDTKDTVCTNVSLVKPQYAIYSEEYLPDTLEQHGHKKADITVAIFDEDHKKLKYYIADVKSNIRGEDMIFKLCDQWMAGLRYVRSSILNHMPEDIIEEEHMMVFTRLFDEDKIQQMIDKRQEEVDVMEHGIGMSLAVGKNRLLRGIPLQKELELLKYFIKKQFIYHDRMVKNEIHNFEVALLEYDNVKQRYEYQLKISI